jgi:hypothetical protein
MNTLSSLARGSSRPLTRKPTIQLASSLYRAARWLATWTPAQTHTSSLPIQRARPTNGPHQRKDPAPCPTPTPTPGVLIAAKVHRDHHSHRALTAEVGDDTFSWYCIADLLAAMLADDIMNRIHDGRLHRQGITADTVYQHIAGRIDEALNPNLDDTA